MLRTVQHLLRGSLLHDCPALHHRHGIGQGSDHGEVMADQDDPGAAPFHVPQQRQDLRLDGDVQGGGGLIGDHQPRVQSDRRRDQCPLPQPAGELVRALAGAQLRLRNPHTGQQLNRLGGPGPPVAPAVQAQRLLDFPAHRPQRIQ